MFAADPLHLRFDITPEAAEGLPRCRVVRRYRKGRPKTRQLLRIYYDTPREALYRSDVELRVSQIGSRCTQEVRVGDGAAAPRRWTCELDGREPGLGQIEDDSFPQKLLRRGWDERLEPLFSCRGEQTSVRLRHDGTVMQLFILDGRLETMGTRQSRSEPVCEAELRLVSGDPVRMMDVALELIEDHDMTFRGHSLSVHGYSLAAPYLHPRPKKAKKVSVGPEMTVRDAFMASVEGVLAHLYANEIPTLEGRPEGIHQSRVAIRRGRAVLRAFKKALPYGGRKAFNYEFRWFQKRMGPARDWHVFLDETIPNMVAGGVEVDELDKLRRIARDERLRASREAADHLRSRRFTRLLLQFQRWLEVLRQEDSRGRLDKPLGPFARRVLDKTRRELLRDTRPLVRMSGTDVHALRIRGKKARYAGEFFRALYPKKIARRQLRLLERFQDLLGEANDASVARELLTRLKPGRLSPHTALVVSEWAGERLRYCSLTAQESWREMQRLEPFWWFEAVKKEEKEDSPNSDPPASTDPPTPPESDEATFAKAS